MLIAHHLFSDDTGPNPLLAVQLMTTLNLYPHIFIIPSAISTIPSNDFFPAPHSARDALVGGQILQSLLSGGLRPYVHPSLFAKLGGKRLSFMWLAVSLLPYRGGVLKERKRDISMAEVVIRDGIKVSLSF
jgi:tRNA nucleotidyltransferase (CCA-adding enzyme)